MTFGLRTSVQYRRNSRKTLLRGYEGCGEGVQFQIDCDKATEEYIVAEFASTKVDEENFYNNQVANGLYDYYRLDELHRLHK